MISAKVMATVGAEDVAGVTRKWTHQVEASVRDGGTRLARETARRRSARRCRRSRLLLAVAGSAVGSGLGCMSFIRRLCWSGELPYVGWAGHRFSRALNP